MQLPPVTKWRQTSATNWQPSCSFSVYFQLERQSNPTSYTNQREDHSIVLCVCANSGRISSSVVIIHSQKCQLSSWIPDNKARVWEIALAYLQVYSPIHEIMSQDNWFEAKHQHQIPLKLPSPTRSNSHIASVGHHVPLSCWRHDQASRPCKVVHILSCLVSKIGEQYDYEPITDLATFPQLS